MKLLAIPVLLAAALVATPAQAKLKVFACAGADTSAASRRAGMAKAFIGSSRC